MTTEEREQILDLCCRRISEEEFLSKFPVNPRLNRSYANRALEDAYANQNSDDVEFALLLGFRFDCIDISTVDILCRLIVEDWHISHEDIASEMQRQRDPRCVSVLYRTALVRLAYLAYDDAHALAVKCLWALSDIGTQEALEKIELLTGSDVGVIRMNAEMLLEMRRDAKEREILASYTESTVRVYQAFSDDIADAALRQQRFVPPFKMDRMTWIKPSFLWMMYRSSWATSQGQTRILAIDISREGFEWALLHSCRSDFDARIHSSRDEWVSCKETASVRIQWDPARNLALDRLEKRTIQIGLGPEASQQYVQHWIWKISDVTPLARKVHELVQSGLKSEAESLLPVEKEYPLSAAVKRVVGIFPPE